MAAVHVYKKKLHHVHQIPNLNIQEILVHVIRVFSQIFEPLVKDAS